MKFISVITKNSHASSRQPRPLWIRAGAWLSCGLLLSAPAPGLYAQQIAPPHLITQSAADRTGEVLAQANQAPRPGADDDADANAPDADANQNQDQNQPAAPATPQRPAFGPGQGARGPGQAGPGGRTLGAPGAAQAPDATAPATVGGTTIEGDRVSLQFPLNPVSDILNIYERLIEKTIIKDTSVFNGPQVSLVTPADVSREEAIRLIEAALLINGYVLVAEPDLQSVKVLLGRAQQQNQTSSFSEGIRIYTDLATLPAGESLIGYFMRLNYISPEDAASIFANHVVLNEFGRITPVTSPSGLLITESTSIIRQLIRLQQIIDVAPSEAPLLTEFVKLEYAEANVVAQIIQATMDARAEERERTSETGQTLTGALPNQQEQQQQQQGGQQSGSQQQQTVQTPGGTVRVISSGTNNARGNTPDPETGIGTAAQPAAQLIPDDRLNRIMVVAAPSDLAYILILIREFDQPLDAPEPMERPLNYSKANDLLPVLVDILQDTGTGQTILPGGRQIETRATPVASSQLATLTGATSTAAQQGQAGTRIQTDATAADGDTLGARPDQLAFPIDEIAPISVLVGKTRLIADRQSNAIIVFGTREAQKMVLDTIDRLDRKPAQVYLATVIGQLTLGDDFEFGIDYLQKFTQFNGADPSEGGLASSLINSRDDVITNGNIADLRDNIITTAFGPVSGLNVYGQIGESLDVFVSALESTNRFKVLSRPVVYTQNGKRAEIASGQRVPVPQETLTDASGNVNNNAAVTTTIGYEEVVLKLEVIPTINKDNEVTLDIVQVNDSVIGNQIIAQNEVPIISTQELNTTVTVPDRTTIVLGGLISETEDKDTAGLPFLSRIPLLGNLVKNTNDSVERTELMIFIQPVVVNSTAEAMAASLDEDLRSKIGGDAAVRFPESGVPTAKYFSEDSPRQEEGVGEGALFPRLFSGHDESELSGGREREAVYTLEPGGPPVIEIEETTVVTEPAPTVVVEPVPPPAVEVEVEVEVEERKRWFPWFKPRDKDRDTTPNRK